MPIAKLELLGGDGLRAAGVDDDGVHQDVAELAPVRPGIHAHAAAGRARDRRRELEAAEARVAGAMQTDRVDRSAAGERSVAVDAHRRELSAELERRPPRRRRRATSTFEPRPIDSTGSSPSPPSQHLLQLVDGLRAREPARGAAGADRREAGERYVLVHAHRTYPASRPTARSTSPAPSTSRTSPGSSAASQAGRTRVDGRRPGGEHAEVGEPVDHEPAGDTGERRSRAA